MKNVIVGVATPIYPSNAARKDLVVVNAQAKAALLKRFPDARVFYDGYSDGVKSAPRIRFYAKLPVAHPQAQALLTAAGRRPTCAKGFAGAFLVDVTSEGEVSTAVAGLSAESLTGKTLKELQAIGTSRGIKISNGTNKAKAIASLLGFSSSVSAPAAETAPAAEPPTDDSLAE